MLSTGEQLPGGHSVLARIVPVAVDRKRLNLDVITEMQASRAHLPHALRAYIEWLQKFGSNHACELQDLLPARILEVRADEFRQAGGHLRQPDAMAQIYVGFEMLMAFALEHNALGESEYEHWVNQAKTSLIQLGADEAVFLNRQDPAEKFVAEMRELIVRRVACFESLTSLCMLCFTYCS